MHPRSVLLAVVTCSLMAVCGGCAASRSARAGLAPAKANAPDDTGPRTDPNAPYLMPAEAPQLIPRATAVDASHAGPCDPEVLSVEEIAGDANGNFRSAKLAFMNRGAVPCHLGGYPIINLIDQEGENIGSVTMEKITPAEVIAELSQKQAAPEKEATASVTLMPHEVAAFEVVWTTAPSCSRVSRILVVAPGTERAFSVAQPMRVCSGRIQVTALRLDEGDV